MSLKLYVYQFADKSLAGIDKLSWTNAEIKENLPFCIAEDTNPPNPALYVESTTLENLQKVGQNCGKDYIVVRDMMKALVYDVGVAATLGTESDPTNIVNPNLNDAWLVGDNATLAFANKEGQIASWNGTGYDFTYPSMYGFNLLTDSQKIICCEHKIGNHAQRANTVGIDAVIAYGLQYHAKSSEARQVRASYAIAEVHNRLPNEANLILYDLISQENNMILTYVNFGIEGTNYDGAWDYPASQPNGIMDYVYGTGNFNGTGLINKGYSPEGVTLVALCTKLEEVLIFGDL